MSLLKEFDALSGWWLAPDDAPPIGARTQALLTATLIDEITGLPPDRRLQATTSNTGLSARMAEGGLAGLVGQPLAHFSPGFITGAKLQLSINGAGYLPLALTVAIGSEPDYPATFAPVPLGSVALHRTPISLAGRTVSRTRTVRAGATVTLDGMWLTLADLLNPAAAPNLVTLASPLYADRGVGATVAQQNLTAAPLTEAKRLLQSGNIGDTAVRLSDQQSLPIGDILALDPQDSVRAEYLAVANIADPGSSPDQPASAVLAFPLARPHRADAVAIRMIPSVAGAANTLARPAFSGDVTLYPASMNGLDATMTALVVSGGAPDEYHAAGLAAATSDADGYVRLPPLHRVDQLRLRVHHPVEPSDLLRDVMLPFGAAELVLDLSFP